MNAEPTPWYAIPILYAVGVLLIALAIPLMGRRIKPNGLYGIRFPATLEDESVWYDINALGGRHLAAIGVVYLVLLTVAVVFLKTWPDDRRFLVPAVFVVVALVADAIFLAIASSRLLAKRRASPGTRRREETP
ncbi:MAG TPA: SdpI family protein [Candidatus Krumholzibacteria bacterium]|nr:SdpI family protein [Candidatus Krumholzibacteria bacterium]